MLSFKRIGSMLLACAMFASFGCLNVFAAEPEKVSENLTIVDNMVDYSVYDSDMVYIQEHADMVEEYNAGVLKKTLNAVARATYTEWNWNTNGIYSFTSRSAAGISFNRSFTPVNNYLYFNAEVTGLEDKAPYLTVNKLNSNGTLTYVGSYNISSTGDGTYEWSNYKRALNAGQKYVFGLWANTNWSYASIDIYKSAM